MANTITENSREDHRNSESLLSAYMDQSLPEAERTALEKEMAGDPFLADALEGLKGGDPETVARSVKTLKKQLQLQISKKAKGRLTQPLMGEYVYWAIGIILFLIIAAFLVLQVLKHQK